MSEVIIEQCPRCGHNYFRGGSGLCQWCQRELNEELTLKASESHDYNNPAHWHNNCREDIKASMTEEQRRSAADSFGPNWANILGGLGDQ